MTPNTPTLTASKVRRTLSNLGLSSEQATVTGKGSEFEIECANDNIRRQVTKATGIRGGYKTGYGSWVLRPGYAYSTKSIMGLS